MSSLDALTDRYLAHLARWAPVASCLLGDARGLGRIDPGIGEPHPDGHEGRELDVLARDSAARAPRGGLERLQSAVLRSRIAERRLRPRLLLAHRRPDTPLDLLAEAAQQVLAWPGLPAARRRSLLQDVLQGVPRVLAATQRRLARKPLAASLTEIALDGVENAASLLVRDLRVLLTNRRLPDPDGALLAATGAAESALLRYGEFLARATTREAGFRCGATVLARWLRDVEHVRHSPRALLARGRRELRTETLGLLAAARAVHPHADPTLTILSLEQDLAGDLLAAARALVPELRDFVTRRDLVSLPDGPPCKVERAPEYLTSLSLACLDTPGPLQPGVRPTRFYIATPGDDSPAGETESLARMFNRTRLAWIAAHETYPGHHVQHLHLHDAPRLLRAADSEVFIEGWAHYAEGLLVEGGFRDGDPRIALGVTWARVVRLCRLVAAIELHAGRASIDAAARVFIEHALLDAGDARREALRAASDPTVLAYTLGRWRIEELRAGEQRRLKQKFDLRAFHDRLLSQGNAPLDLRAGA